MVHAGFLQVEKSHALMSHVLFRVNDLDEARERVANVFSPHDLRVLATGETLDTRMCHVPIGRVSLNRLDYGATVHIDPGLTRDFFLVMMPLVGVSDVTCGKESIRSNPRWAAVVTPTLGLRMRMQHGCDQIVVRVDRALLERYCAQHLGRDLGRAVEFALDMDMKSSQAGSWCRLIELLVSASGQERGMLGSPLVRAHFEQMVVDALLFCQPNTYTEDLWRPAPPIAPHCVKRAEEYIRAHADRPMTIVELAEYAGASTRALYAGFQNFRSVSPMAFLKAVRLERVREELMSGSARRETVTAIAMRWGFSHLGHFTADYKRKFGETPSQTHRRAR
ncbi:MAG: AraC family transcriptional regulator [Burkholderiaceae bacterium]|nr:AraC family transcriptional regulator [Burkholderiaceae bacterium]